MARRWTAGFLSKLLFGGAWWLEVVPEGLRINDRTYGWSSLTSCAVVPGFFWSHLRLGQGDQDIVLRGMSRRLAREIAVCAKALGTMQPALTALRAAMGCDRYLSNKMVRAALATASADAIHWQLEHAGLIAPDLEPLRPDLALCKQVAAGQQSACRQGSLRT